MAKTTQDVMGMIRRHDIKMVDFKIVDINGQYRHVTIPAQNFSEATLKNGIGFDASNYGYAVVEKSDMVFIPDPSTAALDPFCAIPTLSISGNADDSFTNSEWAENNVLWADLNGRFDGIGSDISDLTEGADRVDLAAYPSM